MVYKCFNIYLLRYRVYLECLQVHRRFGGKWWFWCLLEPFECKAAQTRQMFSYGWRPSHRFIDPILWHKIEIWVSFPMPPVWSQSASYSRSYTCLTESGQSASQEEAVDRRCAIGVDLRWRQNKGRAYFMNDWSPETTTKYQNTLRRRKTLFMYFLSHCWRLRFLLFIVLIYERREELLQSPPGTPLVLVLISIAIPSIHLWFMWQLSCLNRSIC